MKKFICLVSLYLVSNNLSIAQNYIPNADFEIGPGQSNILSQGWTVHGPTYWTQTNMTPDYAYYGSLMPSRDNDSAQSGLAYVIFYGITQEAGKATLLQQLQPGISYTLSYYLDIDDNFNYGPSGVMFVFNWFDTIYSPLQTNTGQWEYYQTTFTLNLPSTEIELIGYGQALTKVDNLMLNLTTDINDQQINNTEIKIFPNPFSNYINWISTTWDIKEIIIYEITGRIILQTKFNQSLLLNTDNFSNGIYFYELKDDKGLIKSGKIFKCD